MGEQLEMYVILNKVALIFCAIYFCTIFLILIGNKYAKRKCVIIRIICALAIGSINVYQLKTVILMDKIYLIFSIVIIIFAIKDIKLNSRLIRNF